MPTKRRSSSPCARKSSPHASSSKSYAGPATCTPCATSPGIPSAAAVSASEWKLPRREYARTSSSVTCRVGARSVTRSQRRGRGERHPRGPQRFVGRVGGDDRDLDVDVVAAALLVARDDPAERDQLGARLRDPVALQALAGLDHGVGHGLLEAEHREVRGDRRVQGAGPEQRDGRLPRPASSARWRPPRSSGAGARGGWSGARYAQAFDISCISAVLYAPWRIERESSAGPAMPEPSCCVSWPATPRSRSCTSPPTRNVGRRGGRAVPGPARRLRATSASRRSTRPTSPASTWCSARCRTARARRCCPACSITSATSIDLGADFRLPTDVYSRWYGEPHNAPEVADRFAYGLVELYRDEIASHAHVASPGCYPTAVSLACAPLVALELVEPRIIADAVSGVSGAGRGLKTTSLFSEANENVARLRAADASPHRRDGAGAHARSRAATGAGAVHAAPRADHARHPRHLLRASGHARACRPRACSSTTASSTPTTRAWSWSTSRRAPRPPTAPTSRTSLCASTRAPKPSSRSRRRTTS